jgi:hypothetical protein
MQHMIIYSRVRYCLTFSVAGGATQYLIVSSRKYYTKQPCLRTSMKVGTKHLL